MGLRGPGALCARCVVPSVRMRDRIGMNVRRAVCLGHPILRHMRTLTPALRNCAPTSRRRFSHRRSKAAADGGLPKTGPVRR